MDIRYLDYLSIMSRYVDDKYLDKSLRLSIEKCVQLSIILMELQIGIYQSHANNEYVIRHCGRQISAMNGFRRRHYRNRNLPNTKSLIDFMDHEMRPTSNITSLKTINVDDVSIRIDNHFGMMNITEKRKN